MPARERHGHGAKPENRMPAGENPVALHQGYRASGSDRKIAANELHADHVAGFQIGIFRRRSRCAAGHRRHAPGRKLFSELRQRFGIQAGGNQRRFNRNEELPPRQRWSGEHSFRVAECAHRRSRLGLQASRRASGSREWPRLFPRPAYFQWE